MKKFLCFAVSAVVAMTILAGSLSDVAFQFDAAANYTNTANSSVGYHGYIDQIRLNQPVATTNLLTITEKYGGLTNTVLYITQTVANAVYRPRVYPQNIYNAALTTDVERFRMVDSVLSYSVVGASTGITESIMIRIFVADD